MEKCKFGCDFSGPEWAFHQLMRSHRIAHDAVFEELGLRQIGQPILLFVLSDLRRDGKSCTQKELADFLNLSPTTITISINSLEKRGLINRRTDSEDKRRKYVEISDEGLSIAEKCRCAFDEIDRAMYSGFSPEELEKVTEMFTRIKNNLNSLVKEDEKC